MSRATATVLLTTALLALAAGDAAALRAPDRDGWVLGLSYGGARGKATFGDGSEGETEDGVSPQIRFGRMLGRHLALGASYSGWMYETGTTPLKLRFAMQNILLAGTWYPGRPQGAWAGLHLRAGVGLGWASITAIELVPGEEQGHGDRETESGLGWEVHLGYEFRLSGSMAAGVGFGVNRLAIGKDLYDDATFYPVTLDLAWYWD